jgi:hypothetical protein
MPKLKKKTWVKSKKIIVNVGSCKFCNQEMTNEDSFIPIGKIIKAKYQYHNAHYDCVKENDSQLNS